MADQYIDAMVTSSTVKRSALARWVARGIDAWPRQCELCRTWSHEAICALCALRFSAPLERCPRCALPCAGGMVCGACLREPPLFDGALAAVTYGFPWDRLVTRFKFHHQPELSRGLARRLVCAATASRLHTVDLLLPMPLSDRRLQERGYNQAWELARRVGTAMHLPASPDVLRRWRDTPHQVGLTRLQREANLRDTMWVDPALSAQVEGKRIALIDDVMTTGASGNAAAHALRQAGADQVQVWVVARTPRPE